MNDATKSRGIWRVQYFYSFKSEVVFYDEQAARDFARDMRKKGAKRIWIFVGARKH